MRKRTIPFAAEQKLTLKPVVSIGFQTVSIFFLSYFSVSFACFLLLHTEPPLVNRQRLKLDTKHLP
jgi:hypothetical protein